MRDLLAGDRLDELLRIEPLLEDVGTSQIPRRHQRYERAVENKGAGMHHDALRRDAITPHEQRAVHRTDVVRVNYSLWRARRAGRVDDVVHVIV